MPKKDSPPRIRKNAPKHKSKSAKSHKSKSKSAKSPKSKSKSSKSPKSKSKSAKSPKSKSKSSKSPKSKSKSAKSPKSKSRKNTQASEKHATPKVERQTTPEWVLNAIAGQQPKASEKHATPKVEKSDDQKLNDKILSDIKDWVIISQDPAKRVEWFNNVLSIYSFRFFAFKRTEELVRQTLFRDDYYNKMKESCVWVAASTPAYKKQIVESLIHRFPVYMGKKLVEGWVNIPNMLKHFPYLENETDATNQIIYTMGSLIPCYEKGSDNIRLIGMLHTWGVNFEKDESPDYKKMVHDGVVDHALYRKRVREMFATIFKASSKFRFTGPYEIRIPALGLGAYLAGLKNGAEKNKCKTIFMEELLDASTKLNDSNATVYFCDLDRNNYDLLPSSNTTVMYKNNLLTITNTDPDVIIVNAWDSHSFIGNGGSHDYTIDGMIGAGIQHYIECAAYAQNPFFIPEIVWKLEYV